MNENLLSEERLLAYVDRQLPADEAAQVEAALPSNLQAAQFVQRQRALQQRLQAAFAPVIDEPMPERLLAATRGPAAAPVVDLAAERARRQVAAEMPRRRAAWPAWMGMAASLLLGLVLGQRLLAPSQESSLLGSTSAGLVAKADLAQALSTRSAAQQRAGDPVQVGLSFVAKRGDYCRSFALVREAMAGLACRRGDAWQVQMLAKAEGAASAGAYRQAATALPPAVLQAIDAQIDGVPLDAAAEAAALQRGWQR